MKTTCPSCKVAKDKKNFERMDNFGIITGMFRICNKCARLR